MISESESIIDKLKMKQENIREKILEQVKIQAEKLNKDEKHEMFDEAGKSILQSIQKIFDDLKGSEMISTVINEYAFFLMNVAKILFGEWDIPFCRKYLVALSQVKDQLLSDNDNLSFKNYDRGFYIQRQHDQLFDVTSEDRADPERLKKKIEEIKANPDFDIILNNLMLNWEGKVKVDGSNLRELSPQLADRLRDYALDDKEAVFHLLGEDGEFILDIPHSVLKDL